MSPTTFKFLFCSLLVSSLSSPAQAGAKFLRGKETGEDMPLSPHLDVDLIVDKISQHLYESSRERGKNPPTFVVAGSYPAALKAYKHDSTFILPYNDIDVFIPRADRKDPECEYRRIQKTYYKKGLIPGTDIEVNFVYSCFNSMEHLISDFDINNVFVGFEVVPILDLESDRVVGTIDSWYTNKAYESFLETRVLEISATNEAFRDLGTSFIRLLRKADQLQLDYKLWDTDQMRDLLHGSSFGAKTMGKLNKLPKALQKEVYSRFNLWEIRKGRYMLVLIGEEPPAPDPVAIARKLRAANCYYTDDCDQASLPPTQAPTQAPTPAPTPAPIPFTIVNGIFNDIAVTVESCNLGAPVTIQRLSGQPITQGQQWRRGPVNSLVSVLCPNRVLDVRASNCETSDLILWTYNGTPNQQWSIDDVGNDASVISSDLCLKNLDLPFVGVLGGEATLNDGGVEGNTFLQKWRLRSVE